MNMVGKKCDKISSNDFRSYQRSWKKIADGYKWIFRYHISVVIFDGMSVGIILFMGDGGWSLKTSSGFSWWLGQIKSLKIN